MTAVGLAKLIIAFAPRCDARTDHGPTIGGAIGIAGCPYEKSMQQRDSQLEVGRVTIAVARRSANGAWSSSFFTPVGTVRI
jgi:hypothetical protein